MKKNIQNLNKSWEVITIGSGIGSLTAACLLAKDGLKPLVLERNYLPGGCVSSYYRQGYIFETGATTLVGLDEAMPLRYLLDETGIKIEVLPLEIPMQVYLKTGEILTRHTNLDAWIAEAERVFGKQNQRPFWEYCYRVANFVWQTSLQQRTFPPSRLSDWLPMIQNFRFQQLPFAATAFTSMQRLLQQFDLHRNLKFLDFINEQLLITAQNYVEQVNVLFGCTALCYTNFGNFYVKGGLINLVQPLCDYIEAQGGKVLLRVGADKITSTSDGGYDVALDRQGDGLTLHAQRIVSGIPINNTLELFQSLALNKKYQKSVLPSESLVSAFGMGIGFRTQRRFDCLHHQIHLEEPLPNGGARSIFLSLNHPDDPSRSPAGHAVANVSTHVHDPAQHYHFDKTETENIILETLEKHGFFQKSDIAYTHSYTPAAWEEWIYRKFGFVGGYPQYLRTKPWQMLDARLDGCGAYLCGDTAYPGQGIPGAALSGIIAYEKIKRDERAWNFVKNFG